MMQTTVDILIYHSSAIELKETLLSLLNKCSQQLLDGINTIKLCPGKYQIKRTLIIHLTNATIAQPCLCHRKLRMGTRRHGRVS